MNKLQRKRQEVIWVKPALLVQSSQSVGMQATVTMGAVEGAGDTAQCLAHMPVFIYNDMKYTWARRLYAWSEGTFPG